MRIVALVAARELRSRLRDRSALLTVFAAPVTLALILSFALGDADEFAPVVAVTGPGAPAVGAAATHLPEGAHGNIRVLALPDAAAVRAAVGDERAGAGIVTEREPDGTPVSRVVTDPGSPLAGAVATALAQTAAGLAAGAPPTLPLTVQAPPRASAADYYGPSMAVFFAFFVTAFAPLSALAERQSGTLGRIAAGPASLGAVLAGKGVAVLVLTLASTATLWALTTLAFDARWGNPLGVLALALAVALAATGTTTVAALRARTVRQAEGQTSLVTFLGAMVGGNFIPLADLPEPLRAASLATPNGWALRGFVDLSAGLPVRAILPNLLALVLFAVVGLAAAVMGARRMPVRAG